MEGIKRTKKESAQFIQEISIKQKNGKDIKIDGRDRERVDFEFKKQEGRQPKSFTV